MKTNRKTALILVLALAALLVILSGCSKTPQTVSLSFSANPTTGYSWTVSQDPEIFDITDSYTEDDAFVAEVGVGGTHTFILTPKEAGTAEVTFVYAREGGEPASRLTYTFKVSRSFHIKETSMTSEMESLDDMPLVIIQ